MPKKKVLFHSDFALTNTGFGRNAKLLLSYLHKTDKYDITHYCCNISEVHPDLQKTPWKSIGCFPGNPVEIHNHLNSFPEEERDGRQKQMWYGDYNLDRVIKQVKPDFYFGVQDIWGVDPAISRPWFDKINSVIWTTLDSLPILPSAVSSAPKIKNYWIWSSFATKALNEMGHKHVKTVHGVIKTDEFKRLPDETRLGLRKQFNIEPDRFMVGFVFRNQVRKTIPKLLEGYKIFKDKNPGIKTGLLLHTCFSEGWDIPRFADQLGVPKEEVYTTYLCRNCRQYFVHPFVGERCDCVACGAKQKVYTTAVGNGITEEQLNNIYNLMDVYCHPFTSGGQEIPIQEAKLAELITLVTNYSCGEEMCGEGACSLPLDWASYHEIGSQFIKAATSEKSIAENLDKVFKMSPQERKEWGQKARQWTVDNFSVEVVGKFFEEFLDSTPVTNFDFETKDLKNPAAHIPVIQDNATWIKTLYRDILKMNIDENDGGFKTWMASLAQGRSRQDIENYFRGEADKHNKKDVKPPSLEEVLPKTGKKRVLIAMPESLGDVFITTSLLPSIRSRYPKSEWDLYFATKPENFELLHANPHITFVIQFTPEMDNHLNMVQFFDVYYQPYIGTQRFLDYVNKGNDKIDLKLT